MPSPVRKNGAHMSPPSRPPTLWKATWWIARKELVTSFRDRQTAIYAVVLPVCLYPVLFWMMIQGALLVQGRREHTAVTVGVIHAPATEIPGGLVEALQDSGEVETEGLPPLRRVDATILGTATGEEAVRESWRSPTESHRDALLFLGAEGEAPALLCYDSTDSRSTLAEKRVKARVTSFAAELREDAARELGRDPRDLHPMAIDSRNLAPAEEMGAYVLSMLLPLLLVVMASMGAFYPAVDLTAGERERGTSETTMILPVPRLAIHQGKIIAVCASALLATALNLLALGLSAGHLLKMFSLGAAIEIELPVSAFISIAPLALLFAFAVSALLTGIAALAKSFKEGQALLGPVQMIFIIPAMAGVIPGLELTAKTAMIPVVNVVLAFRSMLRGEELPLEYALTALSLLICAVAAIAFAVRILSRESLQVSNESISFKHIFHFLRSRGSTR
jgi:sodium transport system permease protein